MSIVLNGNFDADLKLTQHFDCSCSDNDEPNPCPPICPNCHPIYTPSQPFERFYRPIDPIYTVNTPSKPIEPFCPPNAPIVSVYTPSQPIEPFCPPTPPIKSLYEPSPNKIVEICPFCVEVEN
jgi:hypothetical protein